MLVQKSEQFIVSNENEADQKFKNALVDSALFYNRTFWFSAVRRYRVFRCSVRNRLGEAKNKDLRVRSKAIRFYRAVRV